MRGFDQIVEEKIRAAMKAGEFDNLPGEGKPLQLDDNPYEPEGWGMAFRLLKKNGYTLPWIEDRQEIEQELERIHAQFRTAGFEDPNAQAEFAARLEALNRRILSYNLRVPSPVFQRKLLDLNQEQAAAQRSSFSGE